MTARTDLLATTAVKAPEPEQPRLYVTSTSHGLRVGDFVTMPVRLTRWERFLLWLARPWRWPARTWQRRFEVTIVASGNTFETG